MRNLKIKLEIKELDVPWEDRLQVELHTKDPKEAIELIKKIFHLDIPVLKPGSIEFKPLEDKREKLGRRISPKLWSRLEDMGVLDRVVELYDEDFDITGNRFPFLFDWAETSEGVDFWDEINDRI